MERVLIFHPGALGDVILSLPFLFSIHKKNAHITLYTQSWLVELSSCFDFVNEWHSIESGGIHKLFSVDFNQNELKWLKNYSKIIALFKKNTVINSNLAKLNLPFVCESFIPDNEYRNHVSFHLSKIFGTSPDYQFIPDTTPEKSGPVIIHPGSGHKLKNWGIENFLQLAQELKNMKKRVLFLLGPAESQYSEILKNSGLDCFSVGLREVYKLLQDAFCFIGNDSGITHLSAVAGTQTLAIFGASDERVWRPIGKAIRVIVRSGTLPPCSSCITRNKIVECYSNNRCMPGYDEVFSAVLKILDDKNE